MFSTLAEVLSPSEDDLVTTDLHDSLDFRQFVPIQSDAVCPDDDGLNPKLRLSRFAFHMDMNPIFFVRQEIKPVIFNPKDGWTHLPNYNTMSSGFKTPESTAPVFGQAAGNPLE
jgi:hypothetical protein